MKTATKALLVGALALMALLSGVESARDVPGEGEVGGLYNDQKGFWLPWWGWGGGRGGGWGSGWGGGQGGGWGGGHGGGWGGGKGSGWGGGLGDGWGGGKGGWGIPDDRKTDIGGPKPNAERGHGGAGGVP